MGNHTARAAQRGMQDLYIQYRSIRHTPLCGACGVVAL